MSTTASDNPSLSRVDKAYLARMRNMKPGVFTVTAIVWYSLTGIAFSALIVLAILSIWFVLPKDLVMMLVTWAIVCSICGNSVVSEGKACRIIRHLDAINESTL